MKKLILSAIVITSLSATVSAQEIDKKFSFSVGPELGIAVGSFSDSHSVGVGGTVQAEYYVMDKMKATGTFGFLGYAGKKISGTNYSYAGQTILPLRVGAKYFLSGGIYAAAQLGVAFFGNNGSGTAFAYSPLMLGYEFKTKSSKSIDATLKYDGYSGVGGTIGSFGIRVAYIF